MSETGVVEAGPVPSGLGSAWPGGAGPGRVGLDELERRGRVLLAEAGCKVADRQAVDAPWLASSSRWLAEAAAGGWTGLTGSTPRERSYRRIAASPHLEAWLIFWPEGGRLQLHDHGGAAGALTVVAGTLDEEYLAGADSMGGAGPLRRRRIATGGGISFDGGYIHDVRNTAVAPATSVHVYGSANRRMGFYRVRPGGLHRLPTVVDGASIVEQDIAADA